MFNIEEENEMDFNWLVERFKERTPYDDNNLDGKWSYLTGRIDEFCTQNDVDDAMRQAAQQAAKGPIIHPAYEHEESSENEGLVAVPGARIGLGIPEKFHKVGVVVATDLEGTQNIFYYDPFFKIDASYRVIWANGTWIVPVG